MAVNDILYLMSAVSSTKSISQTYLSGSKHEKGWQFCYCLFAGLFESAIGLPYLMSLANAEAYRHVCFVCGKRYKSRSKLNRHVRYECGGARNQLQCRVCGRRFSRPDNLRQHSYLHTLQKF